MKQKCIELLHQVAGRVLTKEELHSLESELSRSHAKLVNENPDEYLALSPAERVQKARDRTISDLYDSTARSFENELRSRISLENFKQGVMQASSGKRVEALSDTIRHKAGSLGTALEHDIVSETNKILSDVHATIKDYGETHWGYLQDPMKREVIVRERFGESTGDPHASEIAKVLREKDKIIHQRAERAGVIYDRIDNYLSQPIDPNKVLMFGEDSFVNEFRNSIDASRYFHPDGTHYSQNDIDQLLRSSFETLSQTGRNKAFDNQKQKFSQFSPLGSLTKERQLHFKDADSYLKYMDLVGEQGSPLEMTVRSYKNIIRKVVIAEKFGKDPDTFVRNLVEQSIVSDRKAIAIDPNLVGSDRLGRSKRDQALKQLDSKRREILGHWDVMLNGENMGNSHWAQHLASSRAFMILGKLGRHLFGSVVEDAQILAMGVKKNGLNKAEVRSFLGKGVVGQNQELIHNASLYAESLSASARRFMEDTHIPAVMRRSNETLHKVSGVHYLDRGMKEAIHLPILNTIGRRTQQYASLEHLRKAEGKVNAGLFEHGGFTKDHWEISRLAERDLGPDGRYSIINDRLIQDIDPKKIIPLIESKKVRSGFLETKQEFTAKIAKMRKDNVPLEKIHAFEARRESLLLREAQILKDETSKKIYAIVQKETQTWARGASGASLLDKSRMGLLNAPAGTLGGELLRFILQFKLTPVSIARSMLFDIPNAGATFKKLGIPLTPNEVRSRWIAAAMSSSVIAGTLKSLSNFEEPDPIWSKKVALQAIANILPIYMDYVLHEEGGSTSATSLMSRMAGPVPNTLFELASVVHGMQAGENVSKRLKKLGLNNVPFSNLFYLKGLKDHVIKKHVLQSSKRY